MMTEEKENSVADAALRLAQLRVAISGAELAADLASGAETAHTLDDLPVDQRIHFFQHLTRLTELEFHRVIEASGGIDRFHRFLVGEVKRRQRDTDRFDWRSRVRVSASQVFTTIPSESTMAGSDRARILFPRHTSAVCPSVLRCKAFLKFHNIATNTEPQRHFPDLVEFMTASNKHYDVEKQRCNALDPFFREWMSDVPGVEVWNGQDRMFAQTKSKLDMAFYAPSLESWPLAIIEAKNEEHSSTKADPIAQASHYYIQQLENSPLRGACNAPVLILKIVGTHVTAFAVTHSGHDINGPAVVGVDLLVDVDMGVNPLQDEDRLLKVDAFWLAVKECMRELMYEIAMQLVIDLARPSQDIERDLAWRPAYALPWIMEAGSFRFQYEKAFGPNKLAFLVRLDNERQNEHMVVKFVKHQHYARAPHDLLARHGFAPRIFHEEVIGKKWTILIMEWMRDMCDVAVFKDTGGILTEEHRRNERRALDILHSAGFVHGDLRDANVMVDGNDRVCIVDFDWSGVHGNTRYPVMNQVDIQWPPGAARGAPIQQDHDRWWHNARYRHLLEHNQDDTATVGNADEDRDEEDKDEEEKEEKESSESDA